MSLTDNNDPDRLSSTANNLPLIPSTLNNVEPELSIEREPDTLMLSFDSKID